MLLDYTVAECAEYTARQLNHFFPLGNEVTTSDLTRSVAHTLERVAFCFKHINRPRYSQNGQARFDLLDSDQYCQYLYFLSNTVYQEQQNKAIATKLFYLNKTLHAFNCMFDTQLPDIFWLVHSIGTVLGKATYADYLIVHHNCTIGSLRGEYPILRAKLNMSAGASIIGKCEVGANVILAPGCVVVQQDIPDNSLVSSSHMPVLRRISENGIRSAFHIPDSILNT
jgi:serine O-acetyltransferase